VVFIAYPNENGPLFGEAMLHVRESIARMNAIKASSPFASPTSELIELLMRRAENLHNGVSVNAKASSASPSHPPPLIQQDSAESQYTTDFKPSLSAWQNENFDFADYTRPSGHQGLDLTHSDPSSTPPNSTFDFTCGGIIGQYGPIATVVDNVYYTVPDTWDPMILLERPDALNGNGFAGNGGEYGQDIY